MLSIDGGGIRGMIPAVFLTRLEELLAAELARVRADPSQTVLAALWTEIDEPRTADCFHLIAGTSTGGLLTAGLTATVNGRPKMTAAQSAAIYETHGKEIFSRPLLRNLFDHFNVIWPRYPLAQLREVIASPSVLGDAPLKDARTGVLITSYDIAARRPHFFTDWGKPGAATDPAVPPETMTEAALATAAAPTFFEPALLREADAADEMVDGGVFASNPVLAAISMALRRTEPPVPDGPQELFMVSLGTGSWERPLDRGWGGIFGWLRPREGGEALLEALLDSQADFATEAAHMMLNGWSATKLPGAGASANPGGVAWWEPNLPASSFGGGPRFWRYQALLPEPWQMDDVNKLPDLRRAGTQLADYYSAELERLARVLVEAGPVP